jgi:hypothetical protein
MDRFFGTSHKRAAVLALVLAGAVVLSGCGGQTAQTSGSNTGYGAGRSTLIAPAPGAPAASDGSAVGGGVASEAAPNKAAAAQSSTGVQKLIVVNKTLRIETATVDAAIARIRALAARDGGDIASMQVSTAIDAPVYAQPLAGQTDSVDDSTPLKAFVVVRVPSAAYGSFVAEIAGLGKVLFQSESADDVTQQHVDMQARLGNLQAEQARLRQLFARASSVKDMLAIEQELTRVQGDIESLQAQISYLEKQAAMATVTIELTEPKAIVAPSGIDWGVQTALTDSIRAFVGTMNGLIVLLGPVLALLVFIGLPVLLVVWLVRRAIRSRRVASGPAPSPAPVAAQQGPAE